MVVVINRFPFLFGGTFIEGFIAVMTWGGGIVFPFLFGGTFIEGLGGNESAVNVNLDFPSFSEGLSLRDVARGGKPLDLPISLPFRRDFH